MKRKPSRLAVTRADEAIFSPRPLKKLPHQFVLDSLAPVISATRSMFGCLAIYVDDKIVMCLRDKPDHVADNGIWLATTHDHHASLCRDFPNMRSIAVLGSAVTGWQILPADSPDFEESALSACQLVIDRDPRIGKIPKPRASRSKKPSKP